MKTKIIYTAVFFGLLFSFSTSFAGNKPHGHKYHVKHTKHHKAHKVHRPHGIIDATYL